MFSTLMITFREGVEAFLVIAAMFMYLKKTRREYLLGPMKWGVAVALVGSIVLGVLLAQIGALSPATEGLLALSAFVLVVSCTVHMIKNGKRIAADIKARVEASDNAHPSAAKFAVFLFVVLMIGREGVETATMLASIATNANTSDLLTGGLLGICAAGALSLAWVFKGHAVNLSKFFKMTALFMLLFAVQLAIYSFHEFTEGGVVPGIDNAHWHILTEPFGPEGVYGSWLSYSLGLAPLGFLAFTAVRRRPAAGAATSIQKSQWHIHSRSSK